jgi:hypothetical protein
MNEEVTMSLEEIKRADIFSQISQKKLSKTKAAEVLSMSLRHLRRLYKAFQKQGLSALISKQKGKPSNNQLSSTLKTYVEKLITCEMYRDFGPTFMCEKLYERHGIKISSETTRQLMIKQGVWKSNKKKRPVIHQQRKRRARAGELVQIDGSPHAWFEERGDPCTLITFVDDATGQTYGKFFESETTKAYMLTTWEYILKYGRPLAFYPDAFGKTW